MANNFNRLAYVRTGGALLLLLAGLWAAGLTPLDAFGPPPPERPDGGGTAAERDVVERGTPHHDGEHRDVRSGGLRDQPSRSADALH